MSVKWALRIYRGDKLFVDRDLDDFDDERVRSFLGRQKEENIYGCYQLSAEQVVQVGSLGGLDVSELKLDEDDAAFLEDYSDE